jgi:ribose transport system ATP-binding protein
MMPRVLMQAIDKTFPGVRALRGASLSVAPGEVHVLLGENGAGKSTLMKVLAGQYQPDAGSILLDGVPFAPRSPLETQTRGIAMIHQELSSILPLTVAENLLLGDEPGRAGIIDRAAEKRRARALLAEVGADLSPHTLAGQLSVAQLQMVEIAKALRREARVLIMDEPTAALTDAESDRLFQVIRGLTARGVSVVYISHRMPEIFAIGDRVTVMRDGATVETVAVANTTEGALISSMVGRQVEERVPKRQVPLGETLLAVDRLERAGALGPITFDIRAGEIFALAGLMGSGRTEVARAIFGADATTGGQVRVGQRRLPGTVGGAIAAGLGFVTEDRKAQGLVLDCSAATNMTLAVLDGLCRAGVIDLGREEQLATGHRDRLRIRLSSVHQLVRALSGGNQQKVIIARWLAASCQVLLLDEPTRGVDVGAKAEIYELIGELAQRGVAILLISSDLPELLGLADRVGVMHDGQLAGILDIADATPERVMSLAVGGRRRGGRRAETDGLAL